MLFDVFTIFPEIFPVYLETSILKRAQDNGLLEVHLHDIRDWATDKHHTTDDTPYGGGGGMIMKPEPIFNAVEEIMGVPPSCPLILLTPQGETFTQRKAQTLSTFSHLGLICGRYEGFDERIREHLITEQISIGDYIVSGGELPALVLIEAITRLIPGALGDPQGALDDSFSCGLLEYPQYTRPTVFRGWSVPEILLSGNHQAIQQWRREQALLCTLQKRPDLLLRANLSQSDINFLKKVAQELGILASDPVIGSLRKDDRDSKE